MLRHRIQSGAGVTLKTFFNYPLWLDMHKITKILYKESSIRLIFESAEAFDLPVLIEHTSKLSSGVELSDDDFDSLKKESSDFSTLQLAVKYSTAALRPERKIRDYLHKKGCSSSSIDKAVSKINEYGYIDDYRFAESFVLSLIRRKIVGRIYAEHKLLQKGIDKQIINKVIYKHSEIFNDDERIYEFAVKKYNSLRNKKNIYSKVVSALKSRGFSTSVSINVLNRMKSEGYFFDDQI